MTALFVTGFAVAFATVAWPRWRAVQTETKTMADAHRTHAVAHPGWSFPARVWSAPASLALPPGRRVAHARARGYAEACPARAAGSVCPETGEVIPRGGRFAEGSQPGGTEGWTRPLAMEPVLLGHIVGPDAEIREFMGFEQAPAHLIAALVAAEDNAYFHHRGVNVRGVLRAAWVAARGGARQGASTITMQVVRNLSQRKEHTLRRKVREAMAAIALDAHLGKQAVLELYLNAPYLGQHGSRSICGFQAASHYYYGVDVSQLSVAQAATLASILPAPGRFSPDRHPDEAQRRRDRTLRRMAELGWPDEEIASALAEPPSAAVHPPPEPIHPAYLQAVRTWMADAIDDATLTGAGLDVFTAMDVVVQQTSEQILADRVRFLENAVGRRGQAPLEGAAAVVSPTSGMLVATWGGTQDRATDFNRATQAWRQSGSSIKPLVYALAFTRRDGSGTPIWRAHSTIRNDRHVFKDTDGWYPRNVGGRYSETSTLAMALAWSQNVATASLLEALGGPDEMVGLARRLGFSTEGWRSELGLALGTGEVTPLEMARFVATVSDEGRLASGRPVLTAIDAAGAVRVPPPGPRDRVLEPEAAALTRDLMRLVIEYGTGGAARGAAGVPGLRRPAIGKTGTTDSEKDVWFVGGTPDYASALWLGYDKPNRIGGSASDLAAPLWGWWMRAVHEGLPVSEFGSGVRTRRRAVCRESGHIGNDSCTLIWAPFVLDERPTTTCELQHPATEATGAKYEGLWKRLAREDEASTNAGRPD